MSKKTVRVRLPRKKPSDFFELLKKIVEQHNEMGAASPLNNFSNLDMIKFGQNLQQAEQLYEEAVYHRNMAQSKMHQAKELMGFAWGKRHLPRVRCITTQC